MFRFSAQNTLRSCVDMVDNIWSTHGKKESTNTLTIPTKKTTNNTSTTKTTATPKTTATVKPVKIKAPKVRAHKVQKHKVQKHLHQQTTESQLSDYNLSVGGDSNAQYIIVTYRNQPVYRFTLPKTDYGTWQRMDLNQQRMYVQLRMDAGVFGNNAIIINAIINAVIQALNDIFAEAARIRTQQSQQAHRKMI
jgi:hypothetical protein